VFPTETVYGIGADARSAAAVDRLVAVRGREEGKPILVLVQDLAMAEPFVTAIPPLALRLARRFWPGPLTLVLSARPKVAAPLTAGTGTIGVRCPGHALAAALVAAFGAPITAPSANPPAAPPPRRLAEAEGYFGNAVAAYVDGGQLAGGASTVARIESDRVRIIRPGPITEGAIRHALEGE
jgi:L-threonylcarbamoyladenylate synthase